MTQLNSFGGGSKGKRGTGLGLIGAGAGLQAMQGMPVSNLDWAQFSLHALIMILGIFFTIKTDPADSSVFPNPPDGRLPR